MKIIHWFPRILCILAILFISMFALDAFNGRDTIWHELGAFALHLVPSYILILFMVIAWKWELIGGSILIMMALGLTPFIYIHNYNMNHSVGMSLFIILMINFPFILTGGLFILSHFMKLKNSPRELQNQV